MYLRNVIILLLLAGIFGCSAGSDSPVTPGDLTDAGDGSNPWSIEQAGVPLVEEAILREPYPPSTEYKWYPDIFEPWPVVVEEFYLTSDNGNQIFVDIHKPTWASEEMPSHALVLVPGGLMLGSAWHAPWRKCNSDAWAAAGFLVCDFDFQGRGKSEGIEHTYGPVHRQDLSTVIKYIASLPEVLNGKVGLVSSSWGCTIASATLADYPDLPVRFYIDLEGAQNRHVATQFDDPKWIDIWGGHPTWDDEFWDVREAITFQSYIKVPYIRIQADIDHALKYFYYEHAFSMINAANDGLSPYTRLNHNPPNTYLDMDDPAPCHWEGDDAIDVDLYHYVVEASMETFPGE